MARTEQGGSIMDGKFQGILIVILLCIVVLVTMTFIQGSQPAPVPPDNLQTLTHPDEGTAQKVDEYMTALTNAGRFSGAVLVARGDRVILAKGYGMANQEFSVPNTAHTVFPIGSNTKQLTAAAVMKLQEKGRLNLTDPVTWYLPANTNWKDIRIYHLLNHTSGIPSDGGFSQTDPFDLSLEDIISRISALPLVFEPGSKYTYSNNGYIALSAIISNASGMSYEEYLKREIFSPLNMTRSGQDNARDVFPERATGYTTMNGTYIHYDLQNIHNTYGAGAIHSTVLDLFAWEKAFHTPGVLLSKESIDSMVRNRYGIESLTVGNQTITFHSGRNFGFISHTQYFSDGNVSLIILSNHDRTPAATLPKDLSSIVYDKPYSLPQKLERKPVHLTQAEISSYAGTYEPAWEKSWTFTVYPVGERLFYRSVMPKETVELFPIGNDTFFVTPESNDSFQFTRGQDGSVDGLSMYTMEGNSDLLKKSA